MLFPWPDVLETGAESPRPEQQLSGEAGWAAALVVYGGVSCPLRWIVVGQGHGAVGHVDREAAARGRVLRDEGGRGRQRKV